MDWTGSTAYPPVLSLEDMYAGMVAVVGGKAANLGEMILAGLPVPEGFAVTTEAYRLMAAAAGISGVVDELAGFPGDGDDGGTGGFPGDPAGITGNAAARAAMAAVAARARRLILQAPVPEHLAGALRSAYSDSGTMFRSRSGPLRRRRTLSLPVLPGSTAT